MALTYTPTAPVSDDEVTLSLTGATGSLYVYELTSAPDQSDLDTGLLLENVPEGATAPGSAQAAAEGEYNADSFTPDTPGEYGITAYEFREVVGSPSFAGDPCGDERVELVATQTGTVHVAATVDLQIRDKLGNGATLRIKITDEAITSASFVNPTTEAGRVAALDATVVAELATLATLLPSTIGTQLQTGANDLRTQYEAHRILAPHVHNVADAINVVTMSAAYSQASAIDLTNHLLDVISAHELDTTAHAGGQDLKNYPIVGKASTLGEATVLLYDLRERVYELHRLQAAAPASHTAGDTWSVCSAPLPLDDVVVAYLDALASANPTVASGEPEGATDMAHRFGFVLAG